MENIGGRKFFFAILVVVLGFALVVLKMVSPESWMQFAQAIGGIYVIGNISTKGVSVLGDVFSSKESSEESTSEAPKE